MYFILAGALCVTTLWIKDKRFFFVAYLFFVVLGYLNNLVEIKGLLSVMILVIALEFYRNNGKYALPSFIVIFVLGLMYGLHLVPGFSGLEFIDSFRLTEKSASFDIWYSFDKINFGILFTFFILRKELISSVSDLLLAVKSVILWMPLSIGFVYFLAIVMQYSQVDLSFHSVFIPWAVKNLFFTVLAEEVFFRGLIQRELSLRFSDRSNYLPVIVAAVLFGVAHFAGGIQYIFLSTIAGLIYGYCYKISGKIEMAILAHFTLNSIHFLFFAYPHSA